MSAETKGNTMAGLTREVLITDAAEVLAPAIAKLERASVNVRVLPQDIDRDQAISIASEYPVVIVGFMPFDAPAVASLEHTRLLVRAGIGYDMVDVGAATDAGIWVANVPDFCIDEVADHTLMLLLAAFRRLPEAMTLWRTKRSWHVTAQLPEVRRVNGARLGIVGLGRIGRHVAERAVSCGWEVVGHDPFVTDDELRGTGITTLSLDELLSTSEAVSLHCPLTDENHHLIDADRISRLQDGVILVNTSRGGLVDLDALHDALASGKISYAALDVLDGEPTPDLEHPVLNHPNALITSHTAWFSAEAKIELATNTADEAIRYLDGDRPRNLVNPTARSTTSDAAISPTAT